MHEAGLLVVAADAHVGRDRESVRVGRRSLGRLRRARGRGRQQARRPLTQAINPQAECHESEPFPRPFYSIRRRLVNGT